jgi:hypothetical protein
MKTIVAIIIPFALAAPALAQTPAGGTAPVKPAAAPAAPAAWTDNEFIQAHKCQALEAPASEARASWANLIMAQSTGRTAITESVARDEGRAASALAARAQRGEAQAAEALTAERSACTALKRPEGHAAQSGPADPAVDVVPPPAKP